MAHHSSCAPSLANAAAVTTVVVPDVRASKPFSDLKRPDTFRLQLVGANVLTARVHFTIVSATGAPIWSEWFPATMLLDTYGKEPNTDAEKKAFILKRFNAFFEPKNFPVTAVGPTATFDADYNGHQVEWQEAKQRKAPGFTYLLGLEATQTLSYSPTLKKTVVVYRCC